MQKRNQSFIFSSVFFSSLGYAFIGIFFPILLQNVFGLSFVSALLLVALYWAIYTVLLYPLHWWIMKHMTMSWRFFVGQIASAVFYFFLKTPQNIWWYILLTGFVFAISIAFYWGNLEFVMQKNTNHGKRGKFWGYIQSITIGVNIITPFLSAYFLETDHASWVFTIGIITYIISAVLYLFMNDTSCPTLQKIIPEKNFKKAVISEFFQHGITGAVYPLLVVTLFGSLKIFGFLITIMSAIELIASSFFGHLTDRISAKKMLVVGIFARMFDMFMRIALVFFPTLFTAGIITVLAPLLGPLYQPAYMSRLSRVIEKKDDSFSYWIYRGFLSGMARVILLPLIAFLVWQFGMIGVIGGFFIAGLSVWWVKKL